MIIGSLVIRIGFQPGDELAPLVGPGLFKAEMPGDRLVHHAFGKTSHKSYPFTS